MRRVIQHLCSITLYLLILLGVYAYQTPSHQEQSFAPHFGAPQFSFENSGDRLLNVYPRFPFHSPMEENDDTHDQDEKDEVEDDDDTADSYIQQKKFALSLPFLAFACDSLTHRKLLRTPLYIAHHCWRHFLS